MRCTFEVSINLPVILRYFIMNKNSNNKLKIIAIPFTKGKENSEPVFHYLLSSKKNSIYPFIQFTLFQFHNYYLKKRGNAEKPALPRSKIFLYIIIAFHENSIVKERFPRISAQTNFCFLQDLQK